MLVKVFRFCVRTGSLTVMGNYNGQLGQLKPDGGRVCSDTSFPWFPWRLWLILVCRTRNISVGPFCKRKCVLHVQRNGRVFHTLWLHCQWKRLLQFQMLPKNWQLNGGTDTASCQLPPNSSISAGTTSMELTREEITTIQKNRKHILKKNKKPCYNTA